MDKINIELTKEDLTLLMSSLVELYNKPETIEMEYCSRLLNGDVSINHVRKIIRKAEDEANKLEPLLVYLDDKLANAIC